MEQTHPTSKSRRTLPKSDPLIGASSRIGHSESGPVFAPFTSAVTDIRTNFNCMYCHWHPSSSTSSPTWTSDSRFWLPCQWCCSGPESETKLRTPTWKNTSCWTWSTTTLKSKSCLNRSPSTSSTTTFSMSRATLMKPNSRNSKISFGGSSTVTLTCAKDSLNSEILIQGPPWLFRYLLSYSVQNDAHPRKNEVPSWRTFLLLWCQSRDHSQQSI